MSITAIRWAYDLALPGHLKHTLVTLCYCANERRGGNSAAPGVPKMAKLAGISERNVRYHLNELEDLGVIERNGFSGDTGRLQRWRWALDVEIDLPVEEFQQRKIKGAIRQSTAALDPDVMRSSTTALDPDVMRQPTAALNEATGDPITPEPNEASYDMQCGKLRHVMRQPVAAVSSIQGNQEEIGPQNAKKRSTKSRPESDQEVYDFFHQKGAPRIEADKWLAQQEKSGWTYGKPAKPVKSWKGSAAQWILNIPQFTNGKDKPKRGIAEYLKSVEERS